MSIDRLTMLQRLDSEKDDALMARVKTWLGREDTHVVSERVSKVSVSEALRLWTTRLRNRDITGQKLDGAEAFVSQLKGLAPQRKLEQFAFTGPDTAGNLFFVSRPTHFVGAVIVDLHEREMKKR